MHRANDSVDLRTWRSCLWRRRTWSEPPRPCVSRGPRPIVAPPARRGPTR